MKRIAAVLAVVMALAFGLSAQSVIGIVSGATPTSITLTATMDNNPGITVGADPCQAPQMYMDALGTFAGMMDQGSAENAPVQGIPGTTPDDAAVGLKYIFASTWYYVCQIHNLNTNVMNIINNQTNDELNLNLVESNVAALQLTVNNQQQTLTTLQAQVTAAMAQLAGTLPLISGITASCLSTSSCQISFTTNVAAQGYVKWGVTGTGQTSALESMAGTAHSIGIAPNATSFFYYVCAID